LYDHGYSLDYFFFFLNISNILSVTANPPTTLIVAKAIARHPKASENISSGADLLMRIIAPMMMTPEIAFAPDINGVCKTVGTLEITSKPSITVKMSK